MRTAISQIDKFAGDLGELTHFIKDGDRVAATIDGKEQAGWLDPGDAINLRAALAGRIRRHVLNNIQSDTNTNWETLKNRLKKAYGGGRWAPEEDLIKMFQETKGPRQSNGNFAARLIAWFSKITDKLSERPEAPESIATTLVMNRVLKVHLSKETGRTFDPDKDFLEAAQLLVEEGQKEAETHTACQEEEGPWRKVPTRERRQDPARYDKKEWRAQARRKPHPFAEERRRSKPEVPRRRGFMSEKKCYECGKQGHIAAHCPRIVCFECDSPGHVARQCPYVKRAERDLGEPMEINYQRVNRKEQRERNSSDQVRTKPQRRRDLTPDEWSSVDSDDSSGSEEEKTRTPPRALQSYAAILKNYHAKPKAR